MALHNNRRDYVITHHLRGRFIERTQKRYKHLRECQFEYCPTCVALRDEIKKRLDPEREEINENIYQRLDLAEEDRSYLNNSGFLGWYYNKYGYDKSFEFLVHDDLLFVVIHDEGKRMVVTCVVAKTHLAGKSFHSRIKFNKVKTKEQKAMDVT
jgi:hypothetical protein